MKNDIQKLIGTGILSIGACFAAQAQVTQSTAISGTIITQGTQKDNGTSTTTKAPTHSALTTASLLKQLAIDENTAGNYGSTTFPAGSKLVYVNGTGFEVLDKKDNILVTPSDILTLTTPGQNDIASGTFNDAAGSGVAPFTQTDIKLTTITYDSTGGGGTMKFAVTGLGTFTETAGKPNARTDNYAETDSINFSEGVGEGVNADAIPIILTGVTITSKGTGTLNTGGGTP
ncbi:MAG TPA: hypothetical protein VGN61_14465 [Verrucomicrobiae bacterium]|jgi:hypothetical protein